MIFCQNITTKISHALNPKIFSTISPRFLARSNFLERTPVSDLFSGLSLRKRTFFSHLFLDKYPNVNNRRVFNAFVISHKRGLSIEEFNKIIALKPEHRKKALPFIANKNTLSGSDISHFATLPNKEYKMALRVLNIKGLKEPLSKSEILDLSTMSNKTLGKAVKLMSVKKDSKPLFTMDDAINISKVLAEGPFAEVKRVIKANARLTEMLPKLDERDLVELKNIGLDVDNFISKTDNKIRQTITPFKISKSAKKDFLKYFLANDSKIEEIIRNADFERYGTEGLPLKYSRKDFISDFSKAIKNVNVAKRNDLFKKLEIATKFDNEGNLIFYEGIPTLKNLDLQDPLHKDVSRLITNFTVENEIMIKDPKLNKTMNSMLHAFPIYANVIGKSISGKDHLYSIDIHSLKVLKEALKNPEYQNLSDSGKTVLKLSILFHDIGKQAIIWDRGHQYVSTLYTRNLLKKLTLSDGINDAVCEHVRDHHWGEELGTKSVTPEHIATRFMEPEDYIIAKIFADADLRGINDKFYDRFKKGLSPEALAPVTNIIERIHQTGNIIISNRIISLFKVPEIIFKNRTYKVVNLTKISNSQDLEKFGFERGMTKEKLRFMVHFLPNGDLSKSVKRLNLLYDISNGRVLSATRISLANKETYEGRKYGVMLKYRNSQVGTTSNDIKHKWKDKSFETFVKMSCSRNDTRTFLRDHLIDSLALKYGILSDEEYGQLFKKIMNKNFMTQMHDVTVGNKTIKEEDLRRAIQKSADKLFDKSLNISNEVVIYNSKIEAMVFKENSLEKVPQEMLDFAHENNLPIILIGE